jgi:deoxyribose-phosphate aldolase
MCKYTPERVAAAVDLASLKPGATSVDVSLCCQKAIRYGCASVCVKPYHVPIAARLLEGYDVGVGTVVGFPHGSDSADVKALACYNLIGSGANELDMVLNIAAMKDGDWETVFEEIQAASEICHEYDALLKVILETCYLKESEIAYACECAVRAGADFVKTSTGFGSGGATPEAVRLMVEVVGTKCEVKASGGIRTYEDAETYLDLGCTRLGSSKVVELTPYCVEGHE